MWHVLVRIHLPSTTRRFTAAHHASRSLSHSLKPSSLLLHASTLHTSTRMSDALRYLLILDFEATCGDAVEGQNEIIEFPTLVYDLKEDKVQFTFHEYVRPVIHPTLTPFCVDLTGITQVSCVIPLGCLRVLHDNVNINRRS